ncbi:SEC-C domain-containing protein [Peptostreptococcus equinus]|uniref:SEC-C domain-containing protein n=1 Tax=Peptostreptococcus equinus TaxID=3003601 RepID=A0ABY7JPL9_9FIRM|nr:SEC-C domain-containing protein [Peptostreptococcus sp. CBA3647]WAW15313.1 SEC-C domain-containing protein [Peptostreptococcus sp. CBA3647]
MLNRNDLCHCGSGKKYKKCCMEKDKLNKVDELNNKALQSKKNKIDKKYSQTILKLSQSLENLIQSDEKFAKMEEDAREYLFNGVKIKNVAANRFFASYFSYDFYVDNYNTPAIYAIKHGKFKEDEKRIVYSCVNSYPSLFEIAEIGEREVDIKDVITGKVYKTLDENILGDFKTGDYLLGRPVNIDGIYILIDLTIRIHEETKDIIYNAIMDAYEKNKENIADIEYFISINAVFFYKYMLQLLQLSDYQDEEMEKNIEEMGIDENTVNVEHNESDDNKLVILLEENIKDKDTLNEIMKLWSRVNEDITVNNTEAGWASALEYNYKKSIGESVTQANIATKYGVSVSTLAKRNKEITSILGK